MKTIHSNCVALSNAPLWGHDLDLDEEIPPGGWRPVVDDEEVPLGDWCPPASELPISCAADHGNGETLPGGRKAVGSEHGGILPPGGFRAGHVDTYRTKDGCAYFQFRFVEDRPGVVEMDILSSPNYGVRSGDLHFTHRLPSRRGGYRVCLTNPEAAYSFSQAKKFAKSWAENTWRYIKHGLTF